MKIESEKLLEAKLKDHIKKLGGWSIKILSMHINGLPDRLCLIPGGGLFFAEIKTTKKKPELIQKVMHRKLKKLGFEVYVIDNSELIKEIVMKLGRKKLSFKDWYIKNYDRGGYLYPSKPVGIGFQDYCARVDEYLLYLKSKT